MTNYKIIASDLDGTLLRRDMTVSQENKNAIKKLTDAGVHFVPASGRTFYEIAPEVISDPNVRYVIYSDGAAVYDKELGKPIVKNCIPKENIKELLDIFDDYESLLNVHYNGNGYIDKEKHNDESYLYHRVNKYFRDFLYSTDTPVDNFDDFCKSIDEAELFVAFFSTEEALVECRKRIEATGKYFTAQSVPHNIEVYMKSAGKGNALYALADHLGIEHSETIAVGDSTNDSQMIEMAGLGLAMSNAFDELKGIADATICSNEEHAIDYILTNYVR